MTKKRDAPPAGAKKAAEENAPPGPINTVDGIPDRIEHPARWRYVLLAGVLAGWVAFLIYCALAGRP